MGRAYSYIRFSTPEQIKGDSLRRQVSRSEEWCRRNKHTLDDSLNLRDLGVSAFQGKNAETGRLRAFLDAVEEGRVPKGSVLLVENLDRLTRSTIRQALRLFLSILESGIRLATLDPEHIFEPDGGDGDMTQLLIAITWMARGHDESARKSYRGGEAWNTKRANIHAVKLTAKCPGWLRINDDRTKFLIVMEKVEVVRRIFRLAIEGNGLDAITKRLNGEGVSPLAHGVAWHRSYVLKILGNRAVLGEYQPHTGHGAKERKPIGDAIPDYYPAVVSEADFYRAQTALASRRNKRGPIGANVANLFTGLVRDADDGSTMTIVTKGNDSGPFFVSSAAVRGENGATYASFPYRAFESAMLSWTKEIRVEDVLPSRPSVGGVADQLVASQGRLADLDVRIAAFRDSLATDPNFLTLLGVVKQLETERSQLTTTIDDLKAALHESRETALSHAQDLARLMDSAKGQDLVDLRLRLRSAFAQIVSEIWVAVSPIKRTLRQAMVQVHFRNGGYRRLVLLADRGRLTTWANADLKDGEPETWDLRHRDWRKDCAAVTP